MALRLFRWVWSKLDDFSFTMVNVTEQSEDIDKVKTQFLYVFTFCIIHMKQYLYDAWACCLHINFLDTHSSGTNTSPGHTPFGDTQFRDTHSSWTHTVPGYSFWHTQFLIHSSWIQSIIYLTYVNGIFGTYTETKNTYIL